MLPSSTPEFSPYPKCRQLHLDLTQMTIGYLKKKVDDGIGLDFTAVRLKKKQILRLDECEIHIHSQGAMCLYEHSEAQLDHR